MEEYKKYDAYKYSGIEWIGEIPKEWKIAKLKFITKCLDNLRIPLNSTERSEMKGNIPYWGANSIVDYVNDWLIDEEVILLGEDGAPFHDKLRDVAFYSNEKIWPNNHVHILKVNNKNEIKFLVYSLNITDYSSFITGSTRDKLTQSAMSEIPIQLPPKQEQQRITSFLDHKTAEIDKIINKKENLIEKLKEYKKSVITEAVTKGKLGDKYINEDGELVDEIEMKDSGVELVGEIPNHSKISKLKYHINIIDGDRGKEYPNENDLVDDGILFLSTDNIKNNKFSFKNKRFITPTKFSKLKRGKLIKKDIVITVRGTIGATAIFDFSKYNTAFINAQMMILRSKNIRPYFLYYLTLSKTWENQLNILSYGAAQKQLSNKLLSNIEIIIMSDFIEKTIINYLDQKTNEIESLIQKTKKSIEKYKEYKKSLIFESVTGKIDLRDYEFEGGKEIAK